MSDFNWEHGSGIGKDSTRECLDHLPPRRCGSDHRPIFTVPAPGLSKPEIIGMVVVLPASLVPNSPDFAGLNLKGHPIHGPQGAE